MIIGAETVRRRIDSRNGGASCRSCRYYEAEHDRKDALFGTVKEKDWCARTAHRIRDTKEGQDCALYLKTIYNDEESK